MVIGARAMAAKRLLGSLGHGVVSASLVGGIVCQFIGHPLGYLGGHAFVLRGFALAPTVASQRMGCAGASLRFRAFGAFAMGGLAQCCTALVGGRRGLGRRCLVGLALAWLASVGRIAAATAVFVLATITSTFGQR